MKIPGRDNPTSPLDQTTSVEEPSPKDSPTSAPSKKTLIEPDPVGAVPSIRPSEALVRQKSIAQQSIVAVRAQNPSSSKFGPEGPVSPQSQEGMAATAMVRTQLPRSPYGVTGAASNYKPLRVDVDKLGITHVRLQRRLGEVALFGEHVTAQIHPNGQVTFTGTPKAALDPLTPLEITPQKTPDQVLSTAQQTAHAHYGCTDKAHHAPPELVVVRDPSAEGGLRLAYHIRIADFQVQHEGQTEEPVTPHVIVDATSGDVIHHWNQLHRRHRKHGHTHEKHHHHIAAPSMSEPTEEVDGPQSPERDDFSSFIGAVQLQTTQTDKGFELKTPTGSVETRDANEADPNFAAGRFDIGKPFIDADDTWGGAEATTRIQTAVETHYASTTFVSFLKEVFGMKSIDNQGMKLNALTNIGRNYNNAFWFNDLIHIGHGDGRVFDRLSTIDIIGHELTHGITEKSANLIYDDQSGGLNESYSDVVGTLFEWWHTSQEGAREAGMPPFDWKLGEDTFTPTGSDEDALRFMDDPLADGRSLDHFSQYEDSVDVHFSSGIQNNAFYLAVEGGTHRLGGQVTGLKSVFGDDFTKAMDAAGQIWMRALLFYLRPASTFADARKATIQSAQDLFPNNQGVAQTLAEAWTAVGVDSQPPPQSIA